MRKDGQTPLLSFILLLMPKFTVSCTSSCQAQEAFDRVRKVLENSPDLQHVDSKLSFRFDPTQLKGEASGSLFKADMVVLEKSAGSQVDITVDLPFHLSLAKGSIQKSLLKKLEGALS